MRTLIVSNGRLCWRISITDDIQGQVLPRMAFVLEAREACQDDDTEQL